MSNACGCGVYALPLGSPSLLPVKLGFWLLMLESRTSCGIVGAFRALAYGPLDIRSFLSFGGRSFGRRVGGEQLWCRKIITWAEPSILHQHHNIEPLTTHDERS